jgi:hypothetical protein
MPGRSGASCASAPCRLRPGGRDAGVAATVCTDAAGLLPAEGRQR